MWLIVLEALAAAGVLLFIMWWTMFSGRRKGAWQALQALEAEEAAKAAQAEAKRSPPPDEP
jgi:hypothetical protein